MQSAQRNEIPLHRTDKATTLDKVLPEIIEPTTCQEWQIPVDPTMEMELAAVSTLINQGDYSAALSRASNVSIGDSRLHPTVATTYRALLAQKISQIHLRIAQTQHFTCEQPGRNDINVGFTTSVIGAKTAAEHYQKAIDSLVQGCPELTVVVDGYKKTFNTLQHRRANIVKQITTLARESATGMSTVNTGKLMQTELASSTSSYMSMSTSMIGPITDETSPLGAASADFGDYAGKTIPQLVDLLNATTMVSSAEFASRFTVDVRVPADRAVAPPPIPQVFMPTPMVTPTSMGTMSFADSGIAQEVELSAPSPIPGATFKTTPMLHSNVTSTNSNYSSMDQSTSTMFSSMSASQILPSASPAKQTRGMEKVQPRVPALGMNGLPSSLVLPILAQLQQILTAQYAFSNGLDPMGVSCKMLPLQKPSQLKKCAKRTIEYVSEIDKKIIILQRHLEDIQTLQGTVERHAKWCRGENMATTTQLQDLIQLLETTACHQQQVQTVVESFNKVERPTWMETAMATLGVIDNYRCKEFAACFAPGQDSSRIMETKPNTFMTGTMATMLGKGKTSSCTVTMDTQSADRMCMKLRREAEFLNRSVNELLSVLLAQLAQRDFQQVGFAGCDFFTQVITQRLTQSDLGEAGQTISPRQYRAIVTSLVDQREVLLKRAIYFGRKLEMVYNMGHDSPVTAMKMNYMDSPHDFNGFTASARVYRDLMEIDVDKATRMRGTRFAEHTFSLCNERAMAFAALRSTGVSLFHTEMADFDHIHPGAYMQSIQHVEVKIYSIHGKEMTLPGRLVNMGSSERRVMLPRTETTSYRGTSPDPSNAISHIGFGRQWIHGHPDIMTLPCNPTTTCSERETFQGIGLETAWKIELRSNAKWALQDVSDVVIKFQYRYITSEPLAQVINCLKREVAVFASPKNFGMLHNTDGTVTTPNIEMVGIKNVGVVTVQKMLQPRMTMPSVGRLVCSVVPTKLDKVTVRAVDVPMGMNAEMDNTEMHSRHVSLGEPMALNVVGPTASKRWGQVELVNAQFNGKAMEWHVDPVSDDQDTWVVFQCMTSPNMTTILC